MTSISFFYEYSDSFVSIQEQESICVIAMLQIVISWGKLPLN